MLVSYGDAHQRWESSPNKATTEGAEADEFGVSAGRSSLARACSAPMWGELGATRVMTSGAWLMWISTTSSKKAVTLCTAPNLSFPTYTAQDSSAPHSHDLVTYYRTCSAAPAKTVGSTVSVYSYDSSDFSSADTTAT
ncbi:hypothetical protein GQ600_17741 [Phytophthora cactorum]|nr:hypothetical protein GQ600_17741 [Phytophthora cactorum]